MTDSPKAGESQVNFRKIVVLFEQEGPAEEPLFVNMFQVAFHEEIVYIDVGVIPLDDVLNRDNIGNLLERLGSRDAATPS